MPEIDLDKEQPTTPSPRGKPIRCFDGNAQPYQPFWNFVEAEKTESGEAELELYGVISEYSWFGDEITPKKFKEDLYRVGQGKAVLMRVNSPGGDVIAASRMRAILTDYPGPVTARIEGLAASAAVAVVMAASQVKILDSAYMMIHDPAVVVFLAQLDIETLGKLRDDLKNIKDGIVPVYAERTGLSQEKVSRMMADETWMSAQMAVDLGFADEIFPGGQSQAQNVAYVNCLNQYAHVPPALMQVVQPVNVPPGPVSSEPVWSAEQEREAQTLRERITKILKGDTHA